MNDYDNILEQLSKTLKEIDELTKFDNLSSDNAKKTRSLQKKVDKCVTQLVNNDDGVKKYKSWLSIDDITLKWNASFNLFPLYTKQCLTSLKECKEKCCDKLLKSAMNDVICAYGKGLKDHNIFIQRLKKNYRTDDLMLVNYLFNVKKR